MGDWVRCDAFNLLFVSRYNFAIVSNLTATTVFTLTAAVGAPIGHHQNTPLHHLSSNRRFGMLSGGDEWGNDGGARMEAMEKNGEKGPRFFFLFLLFYGRWCLRGMTGAVAGRGREWLMGWWQTGRMAGAGSLGPNCEG
ncbi:hypothetical protein PVK06_042143 [Gossypium arboreum]|uniref:Uncharacterized protein n=1 Tax=Gossypium arboreum TaxID=29729 RepID=A0ABR0MKB2_GOSAR|nr:hypothetical protein PVK06_042143 [Gossypium arboreum]